MQDDLFAQKLENNWQDEWNEMPEYTCNAFKPYKELKVVFPTEADYIQFMQLIDKKLTLKTKSIYFPESPHDKRYYCEFWKNVTDRYYTTVEEDDK